MYFSSLCLVRQWIDVLRQLRGALGRFTDIFYVRVFSGSEVDSRPALLGSSFYAQSMLLLFPVVGHLENLETTFTSPRTWQLLVRCLCVAVEKLLHPCQTQERCRGSREFYSQVTWHQQVSGTVVALTVVA